jgi:Cys-rich protein (TIGR01571 family)
MWGAVQRVANMERAWFTRQTPTLNTPGAATPTPISTAMQIENLIVNVVILATAYMVWSFACMGQKRATKTVEARELTGSFAPVGLCACLSFRLANVAEAVCCSMFMWAETSGKMKVCGLNFVMTISIVCIAWLMGPLTGGLTMLAWIIFRVFTRMSIRKSLKQSSENTCGDFMVDCLSHVFCPCCAIAQETEFIEHYEKYNLIQEV